MGTIAVQAEKHPDKAAIILGNGTATETFAELEMRSRRLAHLLRARGLEPGGCVAALMDNADPAFFDLYWACHRVGLYFTPVNWHLQEDEVQYIVDNSDADALFASPVFAEVAARVAPHCPRLGSHFATSGAIEGFDSLEAALADQPEDAPLRDELEGSVMVYSSGTTGRPKGVRRPFKPLPAGHPSAALFAQGFLGLFGISGEDRYLCPAPLYHAAPIAFTGNHLRIGASVVILPRFDAELALRCIQDQRVTSSQWVPTHFKRLLQLPEEVRARYDISSLRVAIHAAAPCPIPVKEAMIDWWGDAIVEYYAGSEGGGTLIRAEEWKTHQGSVGRHWAGDIGYVDDEGYLYLTDRQSNMIISGGVNIYPQETENHLIVHPKIEDVAVIGVPNEEMGEEVKAVVIPSADAEPGPELERELIDYCRAGIAHYKCPRSIDFATELPRTETGKMAKRKLRDHYWEGHASRLV
jgi:long-chain acyl-CoA synthetase